MALVLAFENISEISHALFHRWQKIKTLKIKDKEKLYIYIHLYYQLILMVYVSFWLFYISLCSVFGARLSTVPY